MIKISSCFNRGSENYFRLKIIKYKKNNTEKELLKLLSLLGFDNMFEQYYDSEKDKEVTVYYSDLIGGHYFGNNKKFTSHAIFASDFVALVIKCNSKDREELVNLFSSHFKWLK